MHIQKGVQREFNSTCMSCAFVVFMVINCIRICVSMELCYEAFNMRMPRNNMFLHPESKAFFISIDADYILVGAENIGSYIGQNEKKSFYLNIKFGAKIALMDKILWETERRNCNKYVQLEFVYCSG